MINITSSQVSPQLASLFDPHAPAGLRCFSVLAGSDTGKILTDDAGNPRWGAVWEPGDGGLYLAGAQAGLPDRTGVPAVGVVQVRSVTGPHSRSTKG